jgi:signal transduction histidine kinase
MFSYIAFLYGKIVTLGDQAFTEGQELAQQCVTQLAGLNDPTQFPPRLLILFTPCGYRDSLKAAKLLAGINETFEKAEYAKVPLIGGSAEAVFFDRKVHRDGALLICLASRLLKTEVAAALNVTDLSYGTAEEIYKMLDQLDLRAEPGQDVNPFANRLLFALFPGFGDKGYPAPNLYKMMQEKLRARVPIFGGVTSIDDQKGVAPGLQYANGMVYEDAVVAAGITSGTPLALSFMHGLTSNNRILQVSELGADRKTIKRFHQGPALDVIQEEKEHGGVVLLENISAGRQAWMGKPKTNEVKSDTSVRMLREIEEDAVFRVWRPEPDSIHENIALGVGNSMNRIRLEHPIACLGIRCAGYPAIANDINLDLELELAKVEGLTHKYVGAFLAGEAGTDSLGTSYLSNWHTSTLVFGDELRDRTTFHRGFIELAKFARGPALQTTDDAYDRLLLLVHEIGYPGAMISMVLHDQNGEMIIGQDAVGSRYEGIVGVTRQRSDGDDILAQVLRSKKPKFVPNCQEHLPNDKRTLDPLEVLSQYIIPLITLRNEVIALLQIDLGDATYKPRLHSNEKVILDALGNAVNSSLNRVFNWEENKIVARLDKALKQCLSEPTIKRGLQQFLKLALNVFRLKMGHIRIAQSDTTELTFAAGVGPYAEFAAHYRPKIYKTDPSPSIRAFLNPNQPYVTNDATQDSHYQEMIKRYDKHSRWGAVLREVGSYINMGFVSGSGESGTISLVAPSPWFFYWHHERACRALGERVGFLTEHLRRKENETQENRRSRMVSAQVALLAQSSHVLKRMLGDLQPMPQRILAESDRSRREEIITTLDGLMEVCQKEASRRLSLAGSSWQLNMYPCKFGPFIRSLVKKVIAAAGQPPVTVTYDVSDDLEVLMDRDWMSEAFLNIVNNSIDATGRSGRQTRSLKIKVSSVAQKRVSISFTDNGAGMNPQELDSVNQGIRGTTKLKGWGLLLTSILLKSHGGEIENIESIENQGTTVTVTLPQGQQEDCDEVKFTFG